MQRICDIKQKEVINVKDGMKLGNISDIELNLADGRIEKLIVSAASFKAFHILNRDTEYHIKWEQVKRIGNKIVLVDIDTEQNLGKY